MLEDHYLQEDSDMRETELHNLHQTFINAITSANDADFIHVKQYLDQIERSFGVLAALNRKKLKHDEHNSLAYANEYVRRNYF
ncbi:hypothetical protein ACW2QC_09150 [Virgibacillus sp. FSP13]